MHTVSLACVKQALAEEAARLKAAVKDAQDLAKWLTLTEKQRAMAALQAGKAFYGGGQQHLMRKCGWCAKFSSRQCSVGYADVRRSVWTRTKPKAG